MNYSNLQFSKFVHAYKYMQMMAQLLRIDRGADFIDERTTTDRIVFTGESGGIRGEKSKCTLIYAKEIQLPGRKGIVIVAQLSAEHGAYDYQAFWNNAEQHWVAEPSTVIHHESPLFVPETVVSVAKPGDFQLENLVGGPLFFDPKTGAPSRFCYPACPKQGTELKKKSIRTASWMQRAAGTYAWVG